MIQMEQVIRPTPHQYELKDLIGQGTHGCVYRAIRSDYARTIHQEVAVKILNSKNLVEVWNDEFKSLMAVQSPRCVRVFGFEWIGERPALILEFIQGVSLADLMRTQLLKESELIWLGQEIHLGLMDLRQQGLCHGDLSLNNIMITVQGEIRLLDFGFGNYSQLHKMCTPEFASPEVLSGQSADYFADLWSLGQILKKMGPHLQWNPNWVQCLQNSEPTERTWNVKSRSRPLCLGQKVQKLFAQKNIQNGKTTELPAILRTKQKAGGLRTAAIFLTVVFHLLAAGSTVGRAAPPTQRNQEPAKISVRSNFGIEIELDGRKMGYAPVDIPVLRPGSHLLSWSYGGKRKERTLTLQAGDHIVINDSILTGP